MEVLCFLTHRMVAWGMLLPESCTVAHHCVCPSDFSVKPQLVVPPKGIHSENFVHHFRGVEMTELQRIRDIQEFPSPAGDEVNK